jgi:hypothetical protein
MARQETARFDILQGRSPKILAACDKSGDLKYFLPPISELPEFTVEKTWSPEIYFIL